MAAQGTGDDELRDTKYSQFEILRGQEWNGIEFVIRTDAEGEYR